jgi:metal-sulfur cluster biosynthetic enzyme|tara:strand:- start:302 stop:697 length:396 start_codon:yes stop_codon:yes gene_type:complete
MAIYSINDLLLMSQELKQIRVKIFDKLSSIVDPEINTSITELELIDEVDIQDSNVKVDLHLTSPFCPAVFGFKICQDIHDDLLSIDGIDNVKVNVSNHFMAEQINNQVNNSPNPHKKEAKTEDDSSKASEE